MRAANRRAKPRRLLNAAPAIAMTPAYAADYGMCVAAWWAAVAIQSILRSSARGATRAVLAEAAMVDGQYPSARQADGPYPVSYAIDRPEKYNRLTVAFRLILVIP